MILRRFSLALAGLLVLHGILVAQEAGREPMPRFESLLADPDMTAMGARIIRLGGGSDSQLDDDVQADVVLGENFPIVALGRGAHPVSLGMGAALMARFGLTAHSNPLIAQDWSFQVNVANRRGPFTLVGAVWHESYHLGDEYIERFGDGPRGAREGVTLWAFYQHEAWRIGASAGTAFRVSNTPGQARFSGGADYAPVRKGGGILPRAGIFLDLDAQGNWDPALSLRLGAAVPIAGGTDVVISLAGYTGPSTLGGFRPTSHLKYLGLEFRFDL